MSQQKLFIFYLQYIYNRIFIKVRQKYKFLSWLLDTTNARYLLAVGAKSSNDELYWVQLSSVPPMITLHEAARVA